MKKILTRSFYSLVLAVVMCFMSIQTNSLIAMASGGIYEMDLGSNVPRYLIKLQTENVIVKYEGSTFKIGLSETSKDNYVLVDEIHPGSKLRQITLDRKTGTNLQYAPTVFITVPVSPKPHLADITTSSGNITIANSYNSSILAKSESGNISISNSIIENMLNAVTTTGKIDLINNSSPRIVKVESVSGAVNVQCLNSDNLFKVEMNTKKAGTISINGQSYNGLSYKINQNESDVVELNTSTGNLSISNLNITSGVAEIKTKSTTVLSGQANPDNSVFFLNSNIQQDKQIEDNLKSVTDIAVNATCTNLVFEESQNDTFVAKLIYPDDFKTLYSDIKLNMDKVGNSLLIETIYPNGEMNQDADEPIFATLLIQLPHRQYDKVNLNLSLTNSITEFDFPVANIEINKNTGDVSFSVVYPYNNLTINNKVGNFSLNLGSIGKTTVIDNHIGEFGVYLKSEPKDTEITINNLRLAGFDLPKNWNYEAYSGESNGVGNETIKYRTGTGTNTILISSEIGSSNFFINN